MKTLQERLRVVRGNMTQSEFAARLQVPLTTLGRYERGINPPDLAFVINLCAVFGISLNWLLFEQGPMSAGDHDDAGSGQGCRRCPLLMKELDEERSERRELSAEARQLHTENRRLLEENGDLREQLARSLRREGTA